MKEVARSVAFSIEIPCVGAIDMGHNLGKISG